MYSFDSRVRFSECDEHDQLSLVSLVNYFQDCSVFHTEHTGHGLAYLKERGFSWFISTWNIEVEDLPKLGDELHVSTWCYGIKHLTAYRNFTLASPAGHIFARADSWWFLFDFKSGKPIRIPDEEAAVFNPDLAERLEMSKTERLIRTSVEGTQGAPLLVSEQLLDTNQHVNNAHYIELARQAAGLEQARRIQVQYRRAATLGDTIVPVVCQEPDSVVVRLRANDKGDDYAVARLVP